MTVRRIFLVGFIAGVGLALLGPVGLSALAFPGTLATLPLHNLVAQPWWALSLTMLANGLIFGGAAVALFFLALWSR